MRMHSDSRFAPGSDAGSGRGSTLRGRVHDSAASGAARHPGMLSEPPATSGGTAFPLCARSPRRRPAGPIRDAPPDAYDAEYAHDKDPGPEIPPDPHTHKSAEADDAEHDAHAHAHVEYRVLQTPVWNLFQPNRRPRGGGSGGIDLGGRRAGRGLDGVRTRAQDRSVAEHVLQLGGRHAASAVRTVLGLPSGTPHADIRIGRCTHHQRVASVAPSRHDLRLEEGQVERAGGLGCPRGLCKREAWKLLGLLDV